LGCDELAFETKVGRRGISPKPGFWRGHVEVLLILICAIALAGFFDDGRHSFASSTVSGPVTHVRDGDTIEVIGRPIRLQGLNCAERVICLGEAVEAAVRDDLLVKSMGIMMVDGSAD
jgi:hypothetical protein